MELHLVVEAPDDNPRDLAIELSPAASGRDLVDAIVLHLRLPIAEGARRWWGRDLRSGVRVGTQAPVASLGLLQGDRLVLSLERDAPADAAAGGIAWELVGVDGPVRGRRIPLETGDHVVGRAAPSDVQIADDPQISGRHLRLRLAGGGATVTDLNSRNGTYVNEARLRGERAVTSGDRIRAGRSVFQLEPPAMAQSPLRPQLEAGHARATVELVIVGGPASGGRLALRPGRWMVGRDAAADLSVGADLSLSGQHFALIVGRGSVEIADVGSQNGTYLDGERVPTDLPVPLAPGRQVRAGSSTFIVEPMSDAGRATLAETETGHLAFNRPPRVTRPRTRSAQLVAAPPTDPARVRLPIGALLTPLIMGGLILVTMLLLGKGASGPLLVLPLLLMAVTPIAALVTYVLDRRGGATQARTRATAFRVDMAALDTRLASERHAEAIARRAEAPGAAELATLLHRRAPTVWERRPDAPDFLRLRLGLADMPTDEPISLEPGGNEALRALAQGIIDRHGTVPGVPVTVALTDAGVVGLSGPTARVDNVAVGLAVQVCALHSPRDVVLAAVVSRSRRATWDWLKWVPHTRSETSPLGERHLASEPADVATLLASAQRVLRRRDEAAGKMGEHATSGPSIVLFIEEGAGASRAQVDELLSRGGARGIYVVWLGSDPRDLPGECGSIVKLDPRIARLELVDARRGTTVRGVSADGTGADVCRSVALDLAPLRDVSAARPSEGVPSEVPLLELLDLPTPTASAVGARWRSVSGELEAPIGRTASGPLSVSLRRDGPHGLVVGTTGSGKSELLQSYIAALAATYPPTRLTFLLVDGKGGAAFKDCALLPHTVGYVTELDPHIARRALVALEAELHYRETLITQQLGARDLVELERGDPAAAPPNLLIVVDEFGALAAAMPDFTEKLVGIGRKGRSLGMHFILATQSSTGVVTGHIRANTNLRVALRTLNGSESQDVIETPDAAGISRSLPGRALIVSGRDGDRPELTEFQAAYGGGWSDRAERSPEIVVGDLEFEGVRWPARLTSDRPDEGKTDLQALVHALDEAARTAGILPQRRPWLPLLPTLVPLATLESAAPGRIPADGPVSASAPIGLLDDPARQRQEPVGLALESEGSLLIFGASGSGKTTLLRTIAGALAQTGSPADLQLYGLDFASGGLNALDPLPHVGSMVPGDDHEAVQRLFRLLTRTIAERKTVFASLGVATLAEQRAHARGGALLPRIVVLLDGYAGFAAAYEQVDGGALIERLPRLVGEGRPLGVHFVITSERRGAIPSALAGIIARRFVLAMANDDEYRALDMPPDIFRGANLPPGRGFISSEGRLLEAQFAVIGDDPSGPAQGAAVAALGRELSVRHPGASAPAIRLLPVDLQRADLPSPPVPMTATIGLGDESMAAATVDVREGHLLVTGPYRSGRSTALMTIASSLLEGTPDVELHLLAPRPTGLVGLAGWRSVASRSAECDELAERLAAEVLGREPGTVPPMIVVVDDGEELLESRAAGALETIVRRGRDVGVRVVASVEIGAAHRAYSGWVREIRKDKQGVILDPQPDVDGDLFGIRLPRQSKPYFPPGRAYNICRSLIELTQVARP